MTSFGRPLINSSGVTPADATLYKLSGWPAVKTIVSRSGLHAPPKKVEPGSRQSSVAAPPRAGIFFNSHPQ